MKKFLQAAFRITLFQVFLILFFSTLKYILMTYRFEDKIQKQFIWSCVGASMLFLFALGITGIIENRGETYEDYQVRAQGTVKGKFITIFVTWGIAIPAALAYALFLYLVAPTSWSLFAALYGGIIIRNVFAYFSQKHNKINQS